MGCGRAARSEPDSSHTGTISITSRVRRASLNAMKPGIQCVLAQWKPGSSPSVRARSPESFSPYRGLRGALSGPSRVPRQRYAVVM